MNAPDLLAVPKRAPRVQVLVQKMVYSELKAPTGGYIPVRGAHAVTLRANFDDVKKAVQAATAGFPNAREVRLAQQRATREQLNQKRLQVAAAKAKAKAEKAAKAAALR